MKILTAASFLLRYAPYLAKVLPRVTAIQRGTWIKLGLTLLATLFVTGLGLALLLVWLVQLVFDLIGDSGLLQTLSQLLSTLAS
ncbi:hypothetical protein EHS17_12070 [Rhodobacteraceae bacterium CH30]|nr:hypothetical protein EHS17_12070 [Rhodobacteraceae bacterium CH30]